jgi:uncharacterized protein (TIGR03067 family)
MFEPLTLVAVALLGLSGESGRTFLADDLDGCWEVRSFVAAGSKGPEEDAKKYQVVFGRGKFSVSKDMREVQKGEYKLDRSVRPQAIDITWTSGEGLQGKSALGIYARKGVELQICFGEPSVTPAEKSRPREFTSTADPKTTLNTYRRVANASNSTSADPPKTLEEALVRLEKTLGKYDSHDQVEWRLPMDFERKNRPFADQPEVLQVFNGTLVVGHPFLSSEAICWDEVMVWKRQVFDLGQGGTRTLKRTQHSHNVNRYSLSLRRGHWIVTATMLSNGIHESVGRPTIQGNVSWLAEGVELRGSLGVGEYYAPDGKWVLGSANGTVRYKREGERLHVQQRSQAYQFVADPQGTPLHFPDFQRPFGTLFEVDYLSEATSGAESINTRSVIAPKL